MTQPNRPTLFVSDIDGTLLRDDRTLSDFTRETLNGLIDRGLLFTVASARSITSIRPLLRGLRLTLPVIEFNGAFLTDFSTGEHYSTFSIPHDIATSCIRAITETGGSPFVSTVAAGTDFLSYGEITNDGMVWYLSDRTEAADPRLRNVADTLECLAEDVVCFTVIEREPLAHAIRDAVRTVGSGLIETNLSAHRYSPEWWWLTVHSGDARKDRAVARLAEHAGLRDVRVVAFGDDVNDIAMIALADTGVAVRNAHPDVIRAADHVIGSNEQDAVADYIAREFDRSCALDPA